MEAAGLATTTLSMIPALTESVRVPRLAGIGYPLGRPFGQPHDRGGQLQVLRAALATLESIDEPGERVDLPFEWPERRSEVRTHPGAPSPIARLLRRKPWLLSRLISRDVPG